MTVPHAGWRTVLTDVLAVSITFGLVNVISYLYVVIAGRTLTPVEFGVFNVFAGVIGISGFLAGAWQLAVTQAATGSVSRTAVDALMRHTFRLTFPGITLATLVAMAFASQIGATWAQAAICGAIVFLAFQGATALGLLIGLGRIRTGGAIGLFGAAARLAGGWALMTAGAGVAGAVSGYLIHFVIVLASAWWLSWRLADDKPSSIPQSASGLRLETSTIATFTLAFAPFSLDQLLVQAFAPEQGGDYAAVTTIAKLAFFVAYPIIAVTYPHMLQRSDPKARKRLLAGAAAGVTLLGITFASGISILPRQTVELVFGSRYAAAVPFVGPMAFGVACFAVTVLVAHALVAFGIRTGYVPSLVAFVTAVALYAIRHESLEAIVENQLVVYGLQMLLLLALFGFSEAKRRGRIDAPPTVG